MEIIIAKRNKEVLRSIYDNSDPPLYLRLTAYWEHFCSYADTVT